MAFSRMLDLQHLTKSIIFIRSFSFMYTSKTYLIIQAILYVQILSIVFPPFESDSPKWDYENLGPVFLAMGFTARPLTLSQFTSSYLHLAYILLIGIITCMLGIAYTILRYELKMTTIYMSNFNELNKIAKYIGWLRLILLDIGFVPTVYLFVQVSLSGSITIIIEVAAVFYLSLHIFDIFLLRPNSWDKVYTVIALPVYEFMQKAMFFALIVALELAQYGSYPMEYSLTLILYGLFVCSFYYFRMPYARLCCNSWELLKGIALGLSGVLNLMYHEMLLLYDTKFNITMLYFMILPIAYYIARELLAQKYYKLTLGMQDADEISDIKLFHLLFRNRNKEDFKVNEYILGYIKQSRSMKIYIWFLQYCISKKLWADSQVAIALFYSLYSQNKKHSYIEEYKQDIILLAELKNPYLYRSHEFLELKTVKSQLIKDHNLSCFYISKLVGGLLNKKLNISALSKLIPLFYDQIKHTDRLYMYLIRRQSQNCRLLSRYSNFLKAISHPTKSLSINLLSLQCKEQSHYANQKYCGFSNNSTIILYMNSTKSCFKIYKAENAKYLGYSKDNLRHRPIHELFPIASREFYRKVCQESMSLGSESNLFYRFHENYLLNKKEFMMPMIIMYSLIANRNKLEIIAKCMMNSKGLAIAYLSQDGQHVESMVIYIQTYGMNIILADFFIVERKYVKGLNVLNSEHDWFNGMVVGNMHHVIII
jgi:hypothetical protein